MCRSFMFHPAESDTHLTAPHAAGINGTSLSLPVRIITVSCCSSGFSSVTWTGAQLKWTECVDSAEKGDVFTDLHGLVEYAAADLNHLQVLLLLVPRTLNVGHPAPLILLTGVDEIPDGPVLVKHLGGEVYTLRRPLLQMDAGEIV